jgi:hypothetical protein
LAAVGIVRASMQTAFSKSIRRSGGRVRLVAQARIPMARFIRETYQAQTVMCSAAGGAAMCSVAGGAVILVLQR